MQTTDRRVVLASGAADKADAMQAKEAPAMAAPLAAVLAFVATVLAVVGTATRHWLDYSDDFHRGLWSFGSWGTDGAWRCATSLSQVDCNSLRVVQAFCIILLVLSFLTAILAAVLASLPDPAGAVKRPYGTFTPAGRPTPKTAVKYLALAAALVAVGVGAGVTGLWVVYWNESMANFSGKGSLHVQTVFQNVNVAQITNAIVLQNPGVSPLFLTGAQSGGVAPYGTNLQYVPSTGLATVGYTSAYSFILVTAAWVLLAAAVVPALFLEGSVSLDADLAPLAAYFKTSALVLSIIAVCTNYWRDDGMGQHNGLWMTHQDDNLAGGKWISGFWTCRLADQDACEAYQAVQVFMMLDIAGSALSLLFSLIVVVTSLRTFGLLLGQLVFTTFAWGFGLVAMCVWIIFNGYGFGAGLGYGNAGGLQNGQSFYHGPNGYSFALNVAAWVINFAVAPTQLWAMRASIHQALIHASERQAAPIAAFVSLGATVLSLTAATTKHWYEDGIIHKGLWGYGRWAKGAWTCFTPTFNVHTQSGTFASQVGGIPAQQWPAVPTTSCDNIRTAQAFVVLEVIFCSVTLLLCLLLCAAPTAAAVRRALRPAAIVSALLAAAFGMTGTAEAVHDLVPTWKFQGYSVKLMICAWVAMAAVVPAAVYADGSEKFGSVVPELSAYYTFLALVLAVVAAATRFWYDEGVPGGNYFGLWNVGRWDKNGIWYASFGKIHVSNLQTTQIFTLLLIVLLFLAFLSAVVLTINRNLVRLQAIIFMLLTLAWPCGLVAMAVFLGDVASTVSPLPTQYLNIFNANGARNTGSSFALLVAAWATALALSPVVLYNSEWAAINHWAAPLALLSTLASLVLSIVGVATNYWFVSQDLNTHAGLWNIGRSAWVGNGNGVAAWQWRCQSNVPFVFSDLSSLTNVPGGVARSIYKPFSCDSLRGVQLFGICLIGFAFLAFVVTAYVTFDSRKRPLPKVVAIVFAVLGGLCGLISMSIFLGEINRNSWHGFQRQVPVGHSFALVTASWVVLLGAVPGLLYFEHSHFLGCPFEPEEAHRARYHSWAELVGQFFTLSTLVLAIIGTATRHWFDDGVTHLGLWSLGHFEPRKYGSTSSGIWKCTAGRNAYHYGASNMCNPLRATQAFAIGMIGFAFVAFVLAILLSFEATPQRKVITKTRATAASIAAGVCGMIAMAVYLDDFNPFTVDVFDPNFRNHGYSFNLIVAAWTLAIGGSPVALMMAGTSEFGEVVAPLTAFYSLIAVVLSVVAVGTNYWWDAGYQGGHYGLWTVGKWISSADWVNGASTGLMQTKWVCNLPAYYTNKNGQAYGKCFADEIAKTFTSLQTVKAFTILLIIFAGASLLINVYMTLRGRVSQLQYASFFSATFSSISGMIAMAVWLGDIDSWKIGYSLGLEIAAWVVMMWVSVVLVYTEASPQWLAAPFATFFALAATVLATVGTATNYWMKMGTGQLMGNTGSGIFQGVFSSSTGWTNGLLGTGLTGSGVGGNSNLNGVGGNNAAYYLGLWSWGTWGSNGVWTCVGLPGSSSQWVKGLQASCDSIKAVQVFCILFIFMAFLTLVFSAITAFAKGITNFYGVLSPRYAGICASVLGGVFGLVAVAIWLGEVNSTPVMQQFGATSNAVPSAGSGLGASWSFANNLNNQQYGNGLNGPAIVKDMTVVSNLASQVAGQSSAVDFRNGKVVTGILGATQPVLSTDTLAGGSVFVTNLNFGDGLASQSAIVGGPLSGQTAVTWASSQNQISGAGYTYNAALGSNPYLPTATGNSISALTALYGAVPYATLNGHALAQQPVLGNSVSFALVVTAWVLLSLCCPALLWLEEQSLWIPHVSKSVV